MKGTRIGGAEISEYHANFIVNRKNAKTEDVIKLIELIEAEVKLKKKINLVREVIVIK